MLRSLRPSSSRNSNRPSLRAALDRTKQALPLGARISLEDALADAESLAPAEASAALTRAWEETAASLQVNRLPRCQVVQQGVQIGQVVGKPVAVGAGRVGEAEATPVGGHDVAGRPAQVVQRIAIGSITRDWGSCWSAKSRERSKVASGSSRRSGFFFLTRLMLALRMMVSSQARG